MSSAVFAPELGASRGTSADGRATARGRATDQGWSIVVRTHPTRRNFRPLSLVEGYAPQGYVGCHAILGAPQPRQARQWPYDNRDSAAKPSGGRSATGNLMAILGTAAREAAHAARRNLGRELYGIDGEIRYNMAYRRRAHPNECRGVIAASTYWAWTTRPRGDESALGRERVCSWFSRRAAERVVAQSLGIHSLCMSVLGAPASAR
jgi:hypothetical protein